MRFTKQSFKKIMKIGFLTAFCCFFGVGHVLASESPLETVNSIVHPLLPNKIAVIEESNNSLLYTCDYRLEWQRGVDYVESGYDENLIDFYIDARLTLNASFTQVKFTYVPHIRYVLSGDLVHPINYVDFDFYSTTYDISGGDYFNHVTFIFALNRTVAVDTDYLIQDDFWFSDGNTTLNREQEYVYSMGETWFNYFYYESGNFTLAIPSSLFKSYSDGYSDGYNDGVAYVLDNLDLYDLYTESEYLAYGNSEYYRGLDASHNVLSLSGLIREIFRAPVSMFSNAFNFVLPLPDGTSLNVGGILTFFLTIGIALTIVSLISKIGGH